MSFSSVLAYIDFMMMPSSTALELKVQPKYQPTWFDYSKAIPVVLFNLVVLGVPYGYFMFYIFHPTSAFNNKSGQLYFTELPNTGKVMFDVMICVLIEEILFYYSHRLFHLPFFYSKFHKKHHEFTAPIGISAVYTTPLDFLVSNITPLLVGPIVLQSHPVTVWVYFIVAIINTVITHGGYTIPGFPNPKLHDFHHETFNNMYGVIGLLDFVHGTDDKFRSRYNKIDTKAE
ncbi:sterol desaturase [Neoconidiobolus thromboides FSU 785]|nr:sterol desaturase [Neoconidiobolus thromboides FSU 785]